MDYVEFLNQIDFELEDEQQALLNRETHTLVNGVVGSGKSSIICLRSAYLHLVQDVDVNQIWNLCSDSKNAKMMAREYRHFFPDAELPHFMDLYGLAYKIIKMDHEAKELPVWPAYRSNRTLIEAVCKDMFALTLPGNKIEELQTQIAYVKNMLLSDSQIEALQVEGLTFAAFYRMYEKTRKNKQVYDLDDLVIEALHILQKDQAVLEGCHKAISYLQVDDLQEYSFAAHMLLRLVCADHTILFACADTKQCLDTHCAFPQALQTLDSAYEGIEIFQLEKNYRNAILIAEIAERFTHSTMQKEAKTDGDVKFKSFSTLGRLYDYALETVLAAPLQEHVFLYRNEAMVLPLMSLFQQENVLFSCAKSSKSILKQKVFQDICCFIRLLYDPRDLEAFYQVQMYFHLDIPQRVLLEVANTVRTQDVDIYQALHESSLRAASKKKLAGKMEKIRLAATKSTAVMIAYVLKEMQYRQVLEKMGSSEKDAFMLALYTFAERFVEPEEFISAIRRLYTVASLESANIKLIAVDESRGAAYENVYMLDCMSSLFPKTHAQDSKERAMFYTAITRATTHLEFFTFKKAGVQKMELSPFIFEIYQQKEQSSVQGSDDQIRHIRLSDLKRGKHIKHTTMGKGKILRIHEGMMQVQFESETKTLNAKLCIQNDLIDFA